MAIISKIRNQSLLLLVVIGLAMVLFILGDILSSNTNFFRSNDTTVGEINGIPVENAEFEMLVDRRMSERYASRQAGADARDQMRDEVWNDLVARYAIYPEMEEVGIEVTEDEVIDIIKNDPSNRALNRYFSEQGQGQKIIPQFANPQGGVNGQAILAYLKNNVYSGDPQAEEAKNSWVSFKNDWKDQIQLNKYTTLLHKGAYVTTLEAKAQYINTERVVSASYVGKKYSAMPDSTVSYTESDIEAYYNAHKNESQYNQRNPARSIQYVVFDVIPTNEDIQKTEAYLTSIKAEFEAADDDTLFVNEYADSPFNIGYTSNIELPASIDSVIASASVNDVFGPVRNNQEFQLIKILDQKVSPDSANARHILLPIAGNAPEDTATAMALADSLKAVIQANDNFAELAQTYSQDPESARQGGDLGWFTEGRMIPVFNDACFQGKVGDMPIVASQFGVHLIEVMELTEPKQKALIAIVNNVIEPGQTTFETVYNEANSFAIESTTPEQFEENGQSFGILSANDVTIDVEELTGLGNSRSIVNWMYNNEVGSISEPFNLENQFVVALLTEVKEKGVLPLEVVRGEIEKEVIKAKKAEKLMDQMAGETDLNALATKTSVGVQRLEEVKFSDFSMRALNEQAVQGLIVALNPGDVSKPIEGDEGVYVVRVDNVSPVDVANANLAVAKTEAQTRAQSSIDFTVINALRESANIEDRRGFFY